MMKRFLILLFAVFTAAATYAQYPNAPNKLRLGAQTTGDGLLYRHAGVPNWTPSGLNNAWLSVDTLTGDLYAYRGGQWFVEVKGDLQQVYPVVINKSGVNIKRGEVVSVDTSNIIQGDQIRIMPAIGDGGLSSELIMGVAANDIANNASGYVAWFGYVRQVKQSDIAQTGITLNVGDILYLSATEPGRLTNVEPTPPALKTTIALVVRKPNANNMTLLVRPKLNEDLSDLNDVDLNGINNGQTIVWDSINTKWIAGNVGTPIDTSLIATKSYVDSKVDSTRLTQDSILVYYIGGAEVGRDTISGVSGGGTAGTIPLWSSSTGLGNSALTESSGSVTAGGTGFFRLPNGTTAQRPGTPASGMIRYNSTNGALEYYDAAAWEVPVKSATVTGLFTANRLLRSDTNGRLAATSSRFDQSIFLLAIHNTAANTTGTGNLFIGPDMAASNTTGRDNTFIGNQTGFANTTGFENIFIGLFAGRNNTSGSNNIFLGREAGWNNTTAGNNNYFGLEAGRQNTTGSANNFFGLFAGRNNTTGGNNNAFGNNAGRGNASGANNNFFGLDAGFTSTGGSNNNFFGNAAGRENRLGNNNNFFGSNSGRENRGGSGNNFFGLNAGYNLTDTLTGNNNTILGTESGRNIALGASGNLILGNSNDLPTGNGSNQVVIKNLIFGTGASGTGTSVATGARVGINQPAPARTLHVAGEARIVDLTTDTPTRIVGADADGDLGEIRIGTGLTLSGDTLNVTAAGSTNLTFSGASSPVTLNSDTGTDVTLTAGDGISFSQTSNNLTISKASPIYAVVTVDSNRTSTFLAGSVTPDTIDNPKISQVGGVFSVVGNGIQYTSGTSRTFLITANADFKFSEANNIVKFQGWRSNGGTVIDIGTFGTVESVLGNEIMHTSFTAITSLSNNDLLRFGFTPAAHTGDDTLVLTNLSITITQL